MAVTKVKNDGVDFSEASSIAFDTTTLFVDATNDRVGIGTITPSTALDVTGDVTIGGNLTVNGTTTTINSTTLTVDDLNVVLASGAASAAAADGAGITVDGASASLTYVNSGDKWQFNKAVDVTGTVTADGLTVDGNPVINGTSPQIFLQTSNALHYNWQIAAQENVSGAFEISSGNADADATNDTYTKRLVVLNNGDISFYEDTGTTAAFHWDAADERLGIGTTSPASVLHVSDTTQPKITIEDSTNNSFGRITGGGTTGSLTFEADYDNAKAGTVMAFNVDNTERMRIDSSGRVGIGTSSLSKKLNVSTSSNYDGILISNSHSSSAARLQLDNDNSKSLQIDMGGSTQTPYGPFNVDTAAIVSAGAPLNIGTDTSNPLAFYTNLNERMRIASDGKVGIGTTAPVEGNLVVRNDSGDSKINIKVNSFAGTNGIAALDFSTGGQAGTDPQARIHAIGNNNYSADLVFSTQISGTSNPLSERMRILSGGGLTFNGDTATANALDDYEEGSWTPALYNSSGTSISASTLQGRYTKIGNMITIWVYIWDISGAFQTITGFPAADSSSLFQGVGSIVYAPGGGGSAPHSAGPKVILLTQGATQLKMDSNYFSGSNNIWMTMNYRAA